MTSIYEQLSNSKIIHNRCKIADVSNPAHVERAVQEVVDHSSRLNILVNNAAIFGGFWKLKDIPLDGWHKVIDINLTACMLFCKFAAPHMAKNRVGLIINITSIASEMGDAGSVTCDQNTFDAELRFIRGSRGNVETAPPTWPIR